MTTIKEVREALRDYATETGMDPEQRERIEALAAALDGMVLVPREPTEAMLEAGEQFHGDLYRIRRKAIYRAMLKEAE